MALIDRANKKSAEAVNQADTKRQVKKAPQESTKLGSTNRKNIKVSPDTFNLVKTISTMKSIKNYEFIDIAVAKYIENELTEREQRILKNLSKA